MDGLLEFGGSGVGEAERAMQPPVERARKVQFVGRLDGWCAVVEQRVGTATPVRDRGRGVGDVERGQGVHQLVLLLGEQRGVLGLPEPFRDRQLATRQRTGERGVGERGVGVEEAAQRQQVAGGLIGHAGRVAQPGLHRHRTLCREGAGGFYVPQRQRQQGTLQFPSGHSSEHLSGAEEDLVDVIVQCTHVIYRTDVRYIVQR